MQQVLGLPERPQSLGEEVANSISHGIGLLLALVAFPVLVIATLRRGDVAGVVGATVFASTVVLLYFTSMLFHAFPQSRTKRVFQLLDHSAIYLLIAGTYTPFTLGVLHGTWGWILFGLVWSMAAVGIVLKAIGGIRYNTLSTFVYVAMGWLVVVAIYPLWRAMPAAGIVWLVAGGVFYTSGLIFFGWRSMPFHHTVWHLFVIAGSTCHFFAMLFYVLPK